MKFKVGDRVVSIFGTTMVGTVHKVKPQEYFSYIVRWDNGVVGECTLDGIKPLLREVTDE